MFLVYPTKFALYVLCRMKMAEDPENDPRSADPDVVACISLYSRMLVGGLHRLLERNTQATKLAQQLHIFSQASQLLGFARKSMNQHIANMKEYIKIFA